MTRAATSLKLSGHTAFVVLWSSRMPRAVRDDINLNGITNVAQAAVAAGVGRVVHASSVLAYDPVRVRGRDGITEEVPIGKDRTPMYSATARRPRSGPWARSWRRAASR